VTRLRLNCADPCGTTPAIYIVTPEVSHRHSFRFPGRYVDMTTLNGSSPPSPEPPRRTQRVRHLERDLTLARDVDCSVLITGSSSSAREEVAKRLHRVGQFLRVDCRDVGELTVLQGALPFGVGTLFLDHVSELRPNFQSQLVQFLENRAASHHTDLRFAAGEPARVIAGTSQSLFERVRHGEFSADLFYRLNTIHLTL